MVSKNPDAGQMAGIFLPVHHGGKTWKGDINNRESLDTAGRK